MSPTLTIAVGVESKDRLTSVDFVFVLLSDD